MPAPVNHNFRAFVWGNSKTRIYLRLLKETWENNLRPSPAQPSKMRLLHTITALYAAQAAATNNDPLSIQMARSIISRHEGIDTPSSDSSGPLQAGFVQKIFSLIPAQYPNHTLTSTLSSYITQSADSLLGIFSNTSSTLKYSMDRLSSGNAFIGLSSSTGETKYLHAVEVLRSSIDENMRSTEGGFWYYVYPNWSYLDGMFSFGPFWALYALTYTPNDKDAWAELKRQFGLLAEHCAFSEDGEETGLLVHGYDDSRTAVWANNTLGASPHVWGRSLGWYVVGLLDTISIIDNHSNVTNLTEVAGIRDDFVHEFQARMSAIVQAVDPATGAWWQVLDAPGREGNYIESSGSSLFTWALLAGVRKGYLDRNMTYVDVGKRAYGYLRDTFVVHNGNGTLGWNGTVSVCSLNSTASYEYYTSRPILYDSVLGSAAFLGASLEVERLDGC